MLGHTSVCSAISKAPSTTIPRYRTVLSNLVWPSRSWAAVRLRSVVDQGCLRTPQRAGAVHGRIKANGCHPGFDDSSVLPGGEMIWASQPARKQAIPDGLYIAEP